MKHTLTVKGMHCTSCKMRISEALEDAGATQVHINLDAKKQIGIVTLETKISKVKIKEIIEKEGDYTVA